MNREIRNNKTSIFLYEDHFNKRVRLDDYAGDLHEVEHLLHLHSPGWTEKIIAKLRKGDVPMFISRGYTAEAFIAAYFDNEDMYFMTKYLTIDRGRSDQANEEQTMIERILSSPKTQITQLTEKINIASISDAARLADFFRQSFPVYPTSIGNAGHLVKMMNEGAVYGFIEQEGVIRSAASAEINRKYGNAELTDCATSKESEGKSYLSRILIFLQSYLTEQNIRRHYTIARAQSYGINKVFYNLGYTFGGRLINNCKIVTGLEDMNVWYNLE